MKYLMIIAMLFSINAMAYEANRNTWTINDVGVPVIIEANSDNKLAALVRCGDYAHLALYDLEGYTKENIGLTMPIKMRIDSNTVLDVNGVLTEDDEYVALFINTPVSIVREMLEGNTLRIAFRSVKGTYGDGVIERYSLLGLTDSLSKAKDMCAQNNQIKESYPDDKDFFL